MKDDVKNNEIKGNFFENENELLKKTIVEIDSTSEGKVDIGGKKYTKVVKRLEILRKHLGFNIRVSTEPLTITDDKVIFKAEIFILKDSTWLSVATGHAEEIRINNEINKFAAVENAETSAIGRALAALGISGDEYASLDEMVSSLNKKNEKEPLSTVNNEKKLATDSQINYIIKLIKETGSNQEAFLNHYNVKKVKELTPDNANNAIKKLNIKKMKLNESKDEKTNLKKDNKTTLSILEENKIASEKNSSNTDIIIEEDKGEKSSNLKNEKIETIEEVDVSEEVETIEELDVSEEVETIEELDVSEEVEVIEEVDVSEEVETIEEVDVGEEVETIEEVDVSEEVETIEEVDVSEKVETIEEVDVGEEIDNKEILEIPNKKGKEKSESKKQKKKQDSSKRSTKKKEVKSESKGIDETDLNENDEITL